LLLDSQKDQYKPIADAWEGKEDAIAIRYEGLTGLMLILDFWEGQAAPRLRGALLHLLGLFKLFQGWGSVSMNMRKIKLPTRGAM